jgi:hypothetical protein
VAGSDSARLIPDLAGMPPAWLNGAELSIDLAHHQRVGVSFFFTDTAAFHSFCDHQRLPTEVQRDETALRGTFDLVPRHWIKRDFISGKPAGLSQYFTVHPRVNYPITTLRLFLRRHGCPDVAAIEPMLTPSLERQDSQWFLILKRGQAPHPRIACRMVRSLLPDILDRLIAVGFLDHARAQAYSDWNSRLRAGPFVYLSIDPNRPGACSLDFESVHPASLPDRWTELQRQMGWPSLPRYLKCRIPTGSTVPAWKVYLTLRTRPCALQEG